MLPTPSRPRHRSLRRAFAPVVLLVGALLVIAAPVQAALPPKAASFSFHDHDTVGKNWHVELRIDPTNPKKIKTLVVYSQQCKGTIAKRDVPISDTGVIAASGGLKGYGWWELSAVFTDPTTLVGSMRMRRADCDTGVLGFPNAITGDGHTDHKHVSDGHTDHEHGGGHDHGQSYPDFASASGTQRRQARTLHGRVLKKWRGMTPAGAERLGFHRPPGSKPVVGFMFHVYNASNEKDGRTFDARRPESLVFWRRADGESVILGPMFRVPPGRRPRFAGPIPIYHGHKDSQGRVPSQMTHVWMTKGVKSAWANCLPVWHLEQFNPAFKWSQDTKREHVGAPCM